MEIKSNIYSILQEKCDCTIVIFHQTESKEIHLMDPLCVHGTGAVGLVFGATVHFKF